MRRRECIAGLGAAMAWSLAARAQQPMPVIGLLSAASRAQSDTRMRAVRQGLEETGFYERRNVTVDFRWADDEYERLPALAADLVRRKVDVIVALDGGSAFAAKRATTRIPVIFRLGIDPVATGLVSSLNRPGGNVTGVTSLSAELGSKLLELLHQMAPTAKVLALLVGTHNPNSVALAKDLPPAAHALGIELHVLRANREDEFEAAFAAMLRLNVEGLIMAPEVIFTSRIDRLAALTTQHKLPAIYYFREFAAAGGLMSYGNNLSESYRLAGVFAGRVLKGESPTDLPVQQSTKVELVVNLKTAKALGVSVPLPLLARADEVIE